MKIDGIRRVFGMALEHDDACSRLKPRGRCDCGFDVAWKSAKEELATLEKVLTGGRRASHLRPSWLLEDDDGHDLSSEGATEVLAWARHLEFRAQCMANRIDELLRDQERALAAVANPAVRPVESIDHCQVSDDLGRGLTTIDLRVTVSNNHPLVAATLGFFKAPPVPPASGATGGGR